MKKAILLLFLATCLLQLYVPLNMIFQQESIIKEGTLFKFKTRPIDPNDPFRGKYVALNYEADMIEVAQAAWQRGETVYVSIKNDANGFAQIAAINKVVPTQERNYIKAKIRSVWGSNPTKVSIQYPFERFYMEESKAPKAETLFRRNRQNANLIVYGNVFIKDGSAALEDVIVNNTSLKNWVIETE